MPTQPANPLPAPDFDSMLSRKFGPEVANYFSGSPLNRVGFLRAEHGFLSQALRHPSTQFLLCNELQPLIKTSQPANLAWVKHEDVKAVIGEDPYGVPEEQMLKAYDSGGYVPQMVFLGIDETAGEKERLEFQGKNLYKGRPYFAVDVTPRLSVVEECKALIQKLEGEGLSFAKGRVMDIEATDGMGYTVISAPAPTSLQHPPFMLSCPRLWSSRHHLSPLLPQIATLPR